jgi:hypothetical protein
MISSLGKPAGFIFLRFAPNLANARRRSSLLASVFLRMNNE